MALGECGAQVVVSDVELEKAEETGKAIVQKGGQAIGVALDISDKEQFEGTLARVHEQYGRVDVVFNIAGVSLLSEIRDMEEAQWQRVIEVNLMGTLYGSKIAYDRMVRQGHGHIVNIASAAGLMPQPITSMYTMTKYGIVGFTSCLMAEAADLNVKVSLVCPGYVESNIYDSCELSNVDRAQVKSLVAFKMMKASKAATTILNGVAKNRKIIVFPMHARLFWVLNRLFPGLSIGLSTFLVRDFRKIRRETH